MDIAVYIGTMPYPMPATWPIGNTKVLVFRNHDLPEEFREDVRYIISDVKWRRKHWWAFWAHPEVKHMCFIDLKSIGV